MFSSIFPCLLPITGRQRAQKVSNFMHDDLIAAMRVFHFRCLSICSPRNLVVAPRVTSGLVKNSGLEKTMQLALVPENLNPFSVAHMSTIVTVSGIPVWTRTSISAGKQSLTKHQMEGYPMVSLSIFVLKYPFPLSDPMPGPQFPYFLQCFVEQ